MSRDESARTVTRGVRTARERASLVGMGASVAVLHILGWGTLLILVVPREYSVGSTGLFGVGLGLTAYTLGLRHAFDADHIAAIDNTTRKLMSEGKRPLSVGFWFSLGHSTIVFALCALLAAGIRALAGQLETDSSSLRSVLGLVGTSVSGVFLCVIGIINLVILLSIVRVFRRMRQGALDEAALEEQLNNRGVVNRVFGRVTRVITRSWQMYAVGLLFGLGFDTATEVSLLLIAGGAAAFALPWYAILTLPVLFAAGMSLLDSLDGIFMNYAYGWAFTKPVRKVYYNLIITALSVAVALVIGSIELISILADQANITTGPLAAIAGLSLENVGFVIVAIFALAWIIALAAWRFGHIEEKWTSSLRDSGPADRP
jgi:high-affinity nickel-transport protein